MRHTIEEHLTGLCYGVITIIMLIGFSATSIITDSQGVILGGRVEVIFQLSLFSFIVGTLALSMKFDKQKRQQKKVVYVPFSFISSGVLFIIAYASFAASSVLSGVMQTFSLYIGTGSFVISALVLSAALLLLMDYAWAKSSRQNT